MSGIFIKLPIVCVCLIPFIYSFRTEKINSEKLLAYTEKEISKHPNSISISSYKADSQNFVEKHPPRLLQSIFAPGDPVDGNFEYANLQPSDTESSTINDNNLYYAYTPEPTYSFDIEPEKETIVVTDDEILLLGVRESLGTTEALMWGFGSFGITMMMCYLNRKKVHKLRRKILSWFPGKKLPLKDTNALQYSTHSTSALLDTSLSSVNSVRNNDFMIGNIPPATILFNMSQNNDIETSSSLDVVDSNNIRSTSSTMSSVYGGDYVGDVGSEFGNRVSLPTSPSWATVPLRSEELRPNMTVLGLETFLPNKSDTGANAGEPDEIQPPGQLQVQYDRISNTDVDVNVEDSMSQV